jgi:phosphoribosylpyrophosphate synthetase
VTCAECNYTDLMDGSDSLTSAVIACPRAENSSAAYSHRDKRRPKANVSEVMRDWYDIEGRNCVIMDDMIDTSPARWSKPGC